MFKIVLLVSLAFSAGLVLVPEASAACEPGTDPEACTGIVTGRTGNVVAFALCLKDAIGQEPMPVCKLR